ncbi:MAG: hypothetical protein KDA89_09810 [Planctomycetaceae bacterium]|nr:hypothetical protein [Planctomycetaceae bacterium]
MSRRASQSSVSLFPFLAVLVCTMGALILLLLVNTRRIQNNQRRIAEEVARIESLRAGESGLEVFPDEETFLIQPPPKDVESPGEDRSALRTEKQSELDELNHRLQQEQLRQFDLQQQITDAEERLKRVSEESDAVTYQQQVRNLAELREQHDELRDSLREKTDHLSRLQEELDASSERAETAQRMLRERQSALISLRKIVQERQANGDVGTDATVIEFSNSTGTRRDPVIIDVSDAGFEFLPSRIRVTPEEMQGFPANDNPLVSGVLAAHQARGQSDTAAKPYVLLLVRPTGSLAFYAAQRVLTDSGIHFGYELLDEGRHIAAGKAQDNEVSGIRDAVLAALTRRQQLYAPIAAQLNPSNETDTATGSPVAATRQARVLPDGRVLLPGESDPDANQKFYAGGVPLPGGPGPHIVPRTSPTSGTSANIVAVRPPAATAGTDKSTADGRFVDTEQTKPSPGETAGGLGKGGLSEAPVDEDFRQMVADSRLRAQAVIDEALKKLLDDGETAASDSGMHDFSPTDHTSDGNHNGSDDDVVQLMPATPISPSDSADDASVVPEFAMSAAVAEAPLTATRRLLGTERPISGNIGAGQSNTISASGSAHSSALSAAAAQPVPGFITPESSSRSAESFENTSGVSTVTPPPGRPTSVSAAATESESRTAGAARTSAASTFSGTTGHSGEISSGTSAAGGAGEATGTGRSMSLFNKFLQENSPQPDPYLKSLLNHSSSGLISRHLIPIHIDQNYLAVGRHAPQDIRGFSSEQVLAATLAGLNVEMKAVPMAPGATPMPLAGFIVGPGGTTLHIRLERELRSMGIPCQTVFSDAPIQTNDLFDGEISAPHLTFSETPTPNSPGTAKPKTPATNLRSAGPVSEQRSAPTGSAKPRRWFDWSSGDPFSSRPTRSATTTDSDGRVTR